MPNTCVMPNATSVSTSVSPTVRTGGATSGSSTYTPSARSSTGKLGTASLNPPGGCPVIGS